MKLKIDAIGIGLVLLFLGTNGLAQTDNRTSLPAKVTLSYASFGSNDVIRFTPLAGAASYTGEGFYVLGVTYLKPLNPRFYLETGLEFSHHNLVVKANLPPNINVIPYRTEALLLGAPIGARLQLSRHFFAQAGLILDLDLSKNPSIDSQTGLGTTAGLGLNFDVGGGTAIFLNPYLKVHGLLPFAGDNYPQRLVESGFKVGISFAVTRK